MLGYLVTTSGLFVYEKHYHSGDEPKQTLAFAHVIFFTLFIITFEVLFRIWRRIHKREVSRTGLTHDMSIKEFKSKVFDKK